MTRSHSSANRGFPVATQSEDDTNFTLWDDGAAWGHELVQNFVVNLGYADIVLHADAAPLASSVRSISTANGFSNINGDGQMRRREFSKRSSFSICGSGYKATRRER